MEACPAPSADGLVALGALGKEGRSQASGPGAYQGLGALAWLAGGRLGTPALWPVDKPEGVFSTSEVR